MLSSNSRTPLRPASICENNPSIFNLVEKLPEMGWILHPLGPDQTNFRRHYLTGMNMYDEDSNLLFCLTQRCANSTAVLLCFSHIIESAEKLI